MHTNTGLMREKLERLKIRQTELRHACKILAQSIPQLVNPALTDIEEMDVAGAAAKMDELVVGQGELLAIRSRIWDLEDQLG